MKHPYPYREADKTIVFMENDPDLHPIEYILPDAGPIENSINYGLEPKDQKWKRFEMPIKLQEIQDMGGLSPSEKHKILEDNQAYYDEEIDFIKNDWHRILNGCSILINGKQYYMTGDNYFWLQHWRIDGKPVEFRYRDYKSWLFDKMVDDDPDILGINYPKHRREGCTNRRKCKQYKKAITNKHCHCGMQSKDEQHAKAIHETLLMPVWRDYLPFWLKPIWNGQKNDQSSIKFFSPLSQKDPDYGKKSLNSWIDFRDSGEKAYDGLKLRDLFNDEIGKCLAPDTRVLMFDGSIKKAEEIKPGDKLMGPDSTERNVISTVSGYGQMFDIIPNKGDMWSCNSDHILSLKSATKMHLGKHIKKGDIVNISIKDYLKYSELKKRHLVQWMTGVDFQEKNNIIDPYIIGLWIGDGNSGSPIFTLGDKEPIDYVKSWCKENKCKYIIRKNSNKSCRINISGQKLLTKKGGENVLLKELQDSGLLQNKHIPEKYLVNSRKNRLKLLAGLIDSDGHRHKTGYEITQKNKNVATAIAYLCRSLGFFATIKEKIAVLTSKNYSCLVYRVNIFGNNLSQIPVLVSRKKYPPDSTHKNRRNPNHTGIKVVNRGRGRYCGFILDKDHLFLLSDFTVTHNTTEVDVKRRFDIQRQCCMEGSTIIGKIFNGSTVDEMDKGGGRNFKIICDQSHYHKRNKFTNRTASFLVNFFQPASEGFDGEIPAHMRERFGGQQRWIDEYGFDVIDPETGRPAAEIYHLSVRKEYELNGDESGLIEYTRQFPLRWKDCWRSSAKECNFNLVILDSRIDELEQSNPHKQRGNFMWKNNVKDTEVIWCPDENGKFYLSYQFNDPRDANAFYIQDGQKIPANTKLFCAGGDPYKFKETKGKRKSNGGGAVFMKHNPRIDPPETELRNYKTNRFVCTYDYRPKDKKIYGEDMIMMCHYFGCTMNSEINVEFLWDYFEDRGYGRYLYYPYDVRRNKLSTTPGQQASEKTKEEIFREYQYYIQHFGANEVHDELLIQCRDIENDMGDFDLFAAGGYALTSNERSKFEPEKQEAIDVAELFPGFTYN